MPFNLITSDWIPVLPADSTETKMIGLGHLFEHPHNYKMVVGTPQETVGIHRLLLAILYRVYQPHTVDDWVAIYHLNNWKKVADYLRKWFPRFFLFDEEHPFFQDVLTSSVKPVAAMIPHVPSGHWPYAFAPTGWPDQHRITAAEAARQLLAIQSTGLAGLSGQPRPYTDGPVARGMVFFWQGETLFQSLMFNLIPLALYPETANVGVPVWEQDIPPGEREDGHTTGVTDFLTWPTRRIQLLPITHDRQRYVQEIRMMPGPVKNAGLAEPYYRYRRNPKTDQITFVRFGAEADDLSWWRYIPAILATGDGQFLPTPATNFLAELVNRGIAPQVCRYSLMGQATDQAKRFQSFSGSLAFPQSLVTRTQLHPTILEALELSNQFARLLRAIMLNSFIPGEIMGGFIRDYWQRMTANLEMFFHSSLDEQAITVFVEATMTAALAVLDEELHPRLIKSAPTMGMRSNGAAANGRPNNEERG